jgi:hypothetical protein
MIGLTIRATVSQPDCATNPHWLSHVGQALYLLPDFCRLVLLLQHNRSTTACRRRQGFPANSLALFHPLAARRFLLLCRSSTHREKSSPHGPPQQLPHCLLPASCEGSHLCASEGIFDGAMNQPCGMFESALLRIAGTGLRVLDGRIPSLTGELLPPCLARPSPLRGRLGLVSSIIRMKSLYSSWRCIEGSPYDLNPKYSNSNDTITGAPVASCLAFASAIAVLFSSERSLW